MEKVFGKFLFNISPKKTFWWIRSEGSDSRLRCDHLIGLGRYYFVFENKKRCYVYFFHFGRLRIGYIKRIV